MLRKGFKKCVTFALALAFLLSSVAAIPAAAGENDESEIESQVQTNNTEAVEDSEESNVNGEETNVESEVDSSVDETGSNVVDNADSNVANNPEENAESSADPADEETAGGESSADDVSDDAAVEEDQSDIQESIVEESSSLANEESSIEEAQQAAEESMEDISLFSNENIMLLSMNDGISLSSAGANDTNMGLASGIQFYKYEIEYNKYDTNTVEYIVIHDTGNPEVGADAMAHYEFFRSGDKNSSAHYFVDDRRVVQIIDDSEGAWHSGVKYKTPATPISNHNSIGIEMCINADGNYNKAMKNTIDLAAYLLWKYDLDMDHLVRHYDANGKVCPLTMSDNNWADWKEFKAAVQAKRNTYTGQYSGDEEQPSDEGVHYSNAIMGTSVMSADAMAAYLLSANSALTPEYAAQVANAYLTIGAYYGIRGDIAFFQAMLETGNLKFGGEVDASYNNFCGMKAPGDTEEKYEYVKFATVEEGVEAHLQHIYCYASTEPIPEGRTLVDPRFYDWLRGKTSNWEGLSGVWAQPGYDPNEYASLEEAQDKHGTYGDIIIRLYASAGGTNVQTGPAIRGSLNLTLEESYWNDPIYTGLPAGARNVIKLKSTGSDVKEIQGYLKTIGYTYVSVTGTFDANTQRAVKDIQKKNGLTADGVVGEETWAAVINTYVNVVLKQQGREEYPKQDFDDEHVPDLDNVNSGSNTGSSSGTGSSGGSNSSSGSNSGSGTSTTVPVISVSGRSMVYNGCTGSDVKALQQLLNRLGYGLAEDGIFGSGTEAAVRSFQKKYGLTVDGYVGPASWKKLGEVANPKTSSGSGNSNTSGNANSSGNSNAGSAGNTGSGSSSNSTTTKPTGTTISVKGRSLVYFGSTGADVKALQQLLNILGYGLTADGIFGSGTNSAVRSFQSKQGLVVDGYVGSATWSALGKACGSSNTASGSGNSTTGNAGSNTSGSSNSSSSTNISTSGRPTVGYGDSGSNVKALQQLLNKHGYGLAEDGIFGSGTYAAVQKFQASKGLVADGIVGPLTWAKL